MGHGAERSNICHHRRQRVHGVWPGGAGARKAGGDCLVRGYTPVRLAQAGATAEAAPTPEATPSATNARACPCCPLLPSLLAGRCAVQPEHRRSGGNHGRQRGCSHGLRGNRQGGGEQAPQAAACVRGLPCPMGGCQLSTCFLHAARWPMASPMSLALSSLLLRRWPWRCPWCSPSPSRSGRCGRTSSRCWPTRLAPPSCPPLPTTPSHTPRWQPCTWWRLSSSRPTRWVGAWQQGCMAEGGVAAGGYAGRVWRHAVCGWARRAAQGG